jgi:HAD superfamily hydrolase (TIGR01549 family)
MIDVDLVIFDKDGTLIDVHHYWYGMIELRSKKLSKDYIEPQQQQVVMQELMANMGINLDTREIKSVGPVGIKPREFIIDVAYQTVKKYNQSITITQVSSVFKSIDEYSKKHLDILVKPLRGVDHLLSLLQQRDIKVTIATTDLTNRAKLAMDTIGLTHYFDYIAGADLVENAKPSPDLVNYLCDKMSVDTSRALVIGDSIVDLKMAELANVDFIGVKTGLHSPEFLTGSKILVDDLTHIGKML